ncbi:hypothetical protein DSCOOX_59810 [Desulfosarcina ovata subsp. ovata]|uniref:Uncharacterized protein n=2 Tax=Desulfosarcina ovata TaxID=83564 RepID=A0A5K8AJF0_9BACT|nr:hypothetical protein DSCOOX_59810 [Desulfosarcina ovata subsp. ovata]
MPTRQEHFSKSLAVGSKAFVKNICHALKSQAIGRRMIELPAEGYQLRDIISKYGDVGYENLGALNLPLSFSNSIPWRQAFS